MKANTDTEIVQNEFTGTGYNVYNYLDPDKLEAESPFFAETSYFAAAYS